MDGKILLANSDHAKLFCAAGAGIAAAGGVWFVAGGMFMPAVLHWVLGGSAVFTGLILWIEPMMRKGRVRELLEHAKIQWTYPPDIWEAHVARRSRKWKWSYPAAFAIWIAIGVFSVVVEQDLDRAAVIGGCLAIGFGVGAAFASHGRRVAARLIRHGGRAALGEDGFYVTGLYWPYGGFGIDFQGVTYQADEDSPHLRFVFEVMSRHGTATQVAEVPVPPGEEERARAYASTVLVR